jgi:uncharacterized SAM-binding protein YcdF (DUF218 family)
MGDVAGGASEHSGRFKRRLAAVFFAAGVLVMSYRLWLPLVGGFLIAVDPLARADALVPLAGDRSRVIYAAELFRQGYAPWYVVSDMWVGEPDPAVPYATLVQEQAIEHGVPPDRLAVAPGMPRTTYTEALAVRQLALEQGWQSLIVVTSPSHTRRAGFIFRTVFANTNIRLVVVAVEGHWYTPDTWWLTDAGAYETGLEYAKLAAYLLGFR